jgi:hypothetical protein
LATIAAATTVQVECYHRPRVVERYDLYRRRIEEEVELITVKWLLDTRLSKSKDSARKMLNRDCLLGILEPEPFWPRSYRLKEDYRRIGVTYYTVSKASHRLPPNRSDDFQQNRAQIPAKSSQSIPFDSNSSLAQCSVPNNEDTVLCYTDGLVVVEEDQHLFKTAKRMRRWRHRKQAEVCGSKFYQEALAKVAARLAAGDGESLKKKAHNLCFVLQTTAAETYNYGPRRKGHCCFVAGSVMVNGSIKVNYRLYPRTGYLQLQPELSTSPMAIVYSSLRRFMEEIKPALPFETPGTDSWLITLADINIPDWDITEQQNDGWVKALKAKSLMRKLKGVMMQAKLHAYVKKYNGRTWLRVELMQERPHCDLSTFTTSYLEEDLLYKFKEALNKLLLLENAP